MEYSFKDKIKTVLMLIKKPKVFKKILSLGLTGYLVDIGWFNAFERGEPIGKNFEPLPWVTYSFIFFIRERLDKNFTIFEFGSGNSTLFFADKVKVVTTVEHNITWFSKLKKIKLKNINLLLSRSDSKEDYLATLRNSKEKYDIIFIDGIHRTDCCLTAKNYLTDRGIIILDDAERTEYEDGINNLLSSGFKKIDFWGISPGFTYTKATTIFYRDNNCIKV